MGRGIGPREEVVELALWVAGDDAGDCICEVGVGIDAVELGCLYQGGDDGPVLGPPVEAEEERAIAAEGDGADRAFATLLSISMQPSSRKRARPAQRESV